MASDQADLRQRIAGLSPAKQALLELRLGRAAAGSTDGIPAVPNRRKAPVSFPQQRIWWLDQLEPGNSVYNVPRALRMRGRLNPEALRQALDAIVHRHASLRTTFTLDAEEGLLQLIAERNPVAMPVIDLSHLPEDAREPAIRTLALEESQRSFDLACGPVARASLLRLGDQEHVLLWTMHHIVSDGWSAGVLVQELAALYEAFAKGRPSPLPELPIQYADYAVWQRLRLQGDFVEKQLAYWREQLAGAPPVLQLPSDRPRPAIQTFKGSRETLDVPRHVAEALKALSRQEGVTLFMTLLAAFQALVARYTGETDIVVGTPIAGRSRAEIEGLIGCFTNTLVLRTDLSGDPGFRTLLARVREVALGAYAHQDLPFEKLVEDLQPERDLGRNPLFQTLFVLQNAPRQHWELTGLTLEELDIEWRSSKFDLALYMGEDDGRLWSTIEYSTDLFERDTIRRMLAHLHCLLEGVASDPNQRLSRLPLLNGAERTLVVETWNRTTTPRDVHATVTELVRAQAARTPDAIAIADGTTSLTYAALAERAARQARVLRRKGVGPEVLVGVCLERTVDLLVALLAVWEAGGAYVPLDPSYPRARLTSMISDSGLRIILSESAVAAAIPSSNADVLLLDALDEAARAEPPLPVATDTDQTSLAYVIYTSGSTGQPKGVQIEHRSLVNFLRSMRNQPGLSADDRLLAVTTLSFDIAGAELWLPLIVGARVEIVSRTIAADGRLLQAAIADRQATVLQATPATWRMMLDAGWEGSAHLTAWCGGEALPRDLANALLTRCRALWNLYGPTETTIWSSAMRIAAGQGPVPIGGPLANTQLYVLDDQLGPAPVGIPGELYIGGAGVARGYLCRPELTAERFVRDPFSTDKESRLYRTGDRMRYRGDGTLEYLGRLDQQVKVRGFRIEVGEIESALRQVPGVREAAVALRAQAGEEPRLVGYVVASPLPSAAALRASLKSSLPEYMVPSSFVPLMQLPRMPNGKIDRRSLPAPEPASAAAEHTFVTPHDALERQLAGIWQKVLKRSRIGVTDNFFDLGGHSVLAVQLFAQIEKSLGYHLPLTALFQAPTIRQLAELLRGEGWSDAWSSLVPIQPAGSRPPLYCLHAAGGFVLFYRDLAHHLGPDQPVYGLQAQGLDGKRPAHTRVEDMAAHYIDEMRAFQPHGPYYLAGECFGGRIAFEMARQLHAQGAAVGLLALLNTFGPGYPKPLPGHSRLRERLNFLRLRFIDHHWSNLMMLGPLEQVGYAREKVLQTLRPWKDPSFRRQRVRRGVQRLLERPLRRLGHELPEDLRETRNALVEANTSYVPGTYDGTVTLFRATKQPRGIHPDPTLGWGPFVTGRLEIHDVPGSALVLEPRVRGLADRLRVILDRAQAGARGQEPPATEADRQGTPPGRQVYEPPLSIVHEPHA